MKLSVMDILNAPLPVWMWITFVVSILISSVAAAIGSAAKLMFG